MMLTVDVVGAAAENTHGHSRSSSSSSRSRSGSNGGGGGCRGIAGLISGSDSCSGNITTGGGSRSGSSHPFFPFPAISWFNSRATQSPTQTPAARLIRPGLRRGALAGAPAPRAAALRGPHRLEQAALLKLLEALEGRHALPVFYLQLGHVGGAEGG